MPSPHSCSDVMAVISKIWFTEALIVASGSHTDDVPKTSRTYERRWLTQLFCQLGTQPLIQMKKNNNRSLNNFTKNSNVASNAHILNQASVMCVELQQHFTKEGRSGTGPEPEQGPMVSKEPFIVLCSILLLLPNIWANGVRMWRQTHSHRYKKQMTDSWGWAHRLHARLCRQKCASFFCCCCCQPMCSCEPMERRWKTQKHSKNR